jgi:putative cardiolipin synthase
MKAFVRYTLFGFLALSLLSSCAGRRTAEHFSYPKTPTMALEPSPETFLGQFVEPLAAAHPGQSGFYVLGDGIEALVARLQLAQRAERSIDLQYYLLHAEPTGYVFVEQLLKAADRGVRVRMLLDDITTKGYDIGLAALDSHPQIEVRIFNPFSRRAGRGLDFVTDLKRVNHRMHNKSMTVDNTATIVGGRNIGDVYFDARRDMNYNDLDLLAFGPVAQDVSQSFDLYWNSMASVPVLALVDAPEGPQALVQLRQLLAAQVEEAKKTPYAAAFESTYHEFVERLAGSLTWEDWTLVADPPEKAQDGFDPQRTERLTAQLRPVADAAQSELVVVSPYFVPGKSGVAWFRELLERGVRVVVVTNSLSSTDVAPVHAGYSRYRQDLLKAGVELWEIRADPVRLSRRRRGLGQSNSSLHTKAFVVDRRYLFVGSFNFDPRSVDLNTEMGIVLDSPPLAVPILNTLFEALPIRAYRLRLDADEQIEWVARENDTEVVYHTEPQTGFWRRFSVGFLRLLPIEGYL